MGVELNENIIPHFFFLLICFVSHIVVGGFRQIISFVEEQEKFLNFLYIQLN